MTTTTPADNVSLAAWVSHLREKVEQLESSGGGTGSTISANDWSDLLAFVEKLYVSIYANESGTPLFSNMTLNSLKIFGGSNRATDFGITNLGVPTAWYLWGDNPYLSNVNVVNKTNSLLGHTFGGTYWSGGGLTNITAYSDFAGDTYNTSAHYFAYVVSTIRKDQYDMNKATNDLITALTARVATLETKMTSAQSDITSLKNRVTALGG